MDEEWTLQGKVRWLIVVICVGVVFLAISLEAVNINNRKQGCDQLRQVKVTAQDAAGYNSAFHEACP